MIIPKGYKLVPVVPTAHMIAATVADDQGAKGLRAKIAVDAYSAMLASAPTPPQPIYDEPKERELFEEFSRRIVAHDAANFPIRWCDCVTDEEIEGHLNTWLACAQSRAKSVEVGDE